ncbi:MAG: OmpA family protein [Leptolyngbyaceae cyanobacterium RU_5_1]|nr:OmpA family protein [Leptolyngbyaceae cyanobacterium RU_5_1]
MKERGVNRLIFTSLLLLTTTSSTLAQTPTTSPRLRAIVNSSQDGPIQPDAELTLREAISLVNGTLATDQLSDAEKQQVSASGESFRIEFNLPSGQTTIRLADVLPALASPGLVIDGTTQPGYNSRSIINELPMSVPVVAIAPADGKEVWRGLTVVADNITIRGLSLYGFTSNHQNTASTPPADIFIAHRLPPPDISKHPTPANFSPFYADDVPPKNTVIENNWLGIPPSADGSARIQTGARSAFGVSVFNGGGTVIRRNWIADHDGSAIITSVKAEDLQVTENVIIGNGVAGMPDAIRLEGEINQTQVTGNLICANDGSGVYLFKPAGAAQIRDNQITYNGRRLRRAAVYLMGRNHQVTGNQISYQAGSGVVVAAYPTSERTTIQSNRFTNLEGLSIDLVSQQNVGVFDYQKGDGPNPPRNSFFRRLESGDAAINAPQFVTQEFVALGKSDTDPTQALPVQVSGKADPGSQIELYRVTDDDYGYGELNQPIATTEANSQGEFTATLNDLRVGDRISAIATLPNYGTSEPAASAQIRSLDNTAANAPPSQPPSSIPQCVTLAQEPPPVVPSTPEPIRLTVPKNVHFALDKDFVSTRSARVLNRIAQVLLENPTIIIEIQGHADPRASDAYNLNLASRRARNVRNYLLRQGIANQRMTIRSFGERRRRTQGSTKLDYARDRRVEINYQDARNIEVIVQEEDLQPEP